MKEPIADRWWKQWMRLAAERARLRVVGWGTLLALGGCGTPEVGQHGMTEPIARTGADPASQAAQESRLARVAEQEALGQSEQHYLAAVRAGADRTTILELRGRLARKRAAYLAAEVRSLPAGGVEHTPVSEARSAQRSPRKAAAYLRELAKHDPDDPQQAAALRALKDRTLGGQSK